MNAVQHILITGIRVYRCTLSPLQGFVFGPLARCRFTPTCSEYAMDAVRTHGAVAGSWLAFKRICRCNPWGGCGDDPVPQRQRKPSRAPDMRHHCASLNQHAALERH